ncbi:hypothetical protein R6242_09545 [Iodobacter sp. CM08]|uniref:hypothetical protein n=1 Tax=Iodobacter sp. CM08 TaxID=3085902 RepID=UPI0029820943|nr:hypothetical protein [Iodobacter sp. CM08]MDW5416807.1 hypothetical protein [Iodobacter sp. CM08]
MAATAEQLAQPFTPRVINTLEPKRCNAKKINLDVRSLELAKMQTLLNCQPVAAWVAIQPETIPTSDKQADLPLSSDNRALLAQIQNLVIEFNAQLRPLIQGATFRNIDGLSMLPLTHLLNACGGGLAEINQRFDIDTAARMKALRASPLTRGEDRRAPQAMDA